MKIDFFSIEDRPIPVRYGSKNRLLFDHDDKYYHMIDLVSANQNGFEFHSPTNFTVEWNGGPASNDTIIYASMDQANYFYTGMGNGIFSIKTGYIIKTPKDYAILLTSIPNHYKINVSVMTSLVESDWEYIPYYIHIKLMEPGKVEFKKGEPLGFLTIVPYKQMEQFECNIETILSDEELYKKYCDWLSGEPVVQSRKNIKHRSEFWISRLKNLLNRI